MSHALRPLQNRVDPFGELQAVAERGGLMGNRGGRLHRDDQTLSGSRWKNKHWLICVCEFKGRRRDVWGRYYTELFFLDEPTALAAGHRPCFECRRQAAKAFLAAFPGRPRMRWTKRCIASGSRIAPNEYGGRGSATCPPARWSRATGAPTPFAPERCCPGASPAMER